MKILAVLLLLVAAALPAAAQQTRILSLSTNGMLTWSNEMTNASCGIEYSFNLLHTWISIGETYDETFWGFQPTSTVTTAQLDMDILGDLWETMYYNAEWHGLGYPRDIHFFRVVASTNELLEPTVTNVLVFTNASDSTLLDLSFCSKPNMGTTVSLTNFPSLAPAACLPGVLVVGQRVPLSGMDFGTLIHPDVTNRPGWHVTWEQDGTNRHCGTWIVPFGAPDKTVTVTVYNNRVETYYNWLGPGGRVEY